MAEARQRAEWDRAAQVCALLVNVNRDPRKGKPVEPEDFNPYRQKRPQCIKLDRSETMRVLRDFALNGAR